MTEEMYFRHTELGEAIREIEYNLNDKPYVEKVGRYLLEQTQPTLMQAGKIFLSVANGSREREEKDFARQTLYDLLPGDRPTQ
jgi:hypothetical protein